MKLKLKPTTRWQNHQPSTTPTSRTEDLIGWCKMRADTFTSSTDSELMDIKITPGDVAKKAIQDESKQIPRTRWSCTQSTKRTTRNYSWTTIPDLQTVSWPGGKYQLAGRWGWCPPFPRMVTDTRPKTTDQWA